MDSLFPLLVIAGLILLNGLCVAAEFAIVAAPRPAIQRRAAQGHGIARQIHRILQHPRLQDRYIATAQLGITLASLGLGMYGEHILAAWIASWLEAWDAPSWIAAHAVASVVTVVILSYLHIVVGEMVPKAIALQHTERTAIAVTPVVRIVQLVLYPLVYGLNALGNELLKLMGIDRGVVSGEHYHTTEELLAVVRESQEGGLLRPESAQVVQGLLEFGDLTAAEILVPRVRIAGIRLGATAPELRALLRTSPHTRYPVFETDLDHIVGTVHIKDLLRRLLDGRPVRAHDPRPVPYLPQTAPLNTVLAAMRRTRSQMVVVMDEHGGTAGLITTEDLFEEVVGEIDEGASGRPELYEDAQGRLRVAGTVRLEDLASRLDVRLEHEEVDTVSGLVLAILGRPPAVGDVVLHGGMRFEVAAVDGRGVRECIVGATEKPTQA